MESEIQVSIALKIMVENFLRARYVNEEEVLDSLKINKIKIRSN